MLDGRVELARTPFVVMSERIRVKAQEWGIQAPLFVAPSAGDEGLLAAVLQAATSKY